MLIVFVIGMRHGAYPDHLAAIDNLKRNANDKMPRASRFVGTLFALGDFSQEPRRKGVRPSIVFRGRQQLGIVDAA